MAAELSCRSGTNVLIYTVAVGLVLSGIGDGPTAAAAAPDTKLAANIEAFVDKLASNDQFSGAVLFERHGRPLVRRGYGLADRARGRLNTPETPFMLASVGKMFTAVVTATLVQRKQLSFDTTLGTVVPEYPLAEARDRVTVRDLLTMSSGIQDLFRVPAFWSEIATVKSPTDFWRYFASTPLQFRPGTQWSYSNSNFLLLA